MLFQLKYVLVFIIFQQPSYMYKIMQKICIKSEGKAIFWNMQSDKSFLLASKIVPEGCLLLPWGFTYINEI